MNKSDISFLGFIDDHDNGMSDKKNGFSANKGFRMVPLKELVKPIQSPEDEGYIKGQNYLRDVSDVRKCHFKRFEYSHLKPQYNTIRPVYTADDTLLTCNARQITSTQYYILDRVTLICDKVFSRPVLFNPSKGIVSLNKSSYYAFDINTDIVNPLYLINELVKDYVREQNSLIDSEMFDQLSIDDILSICINIPDCNNTLERQKQIYTYEKQILVAELFQAFNMDIDSMSSSDARALPNDTIIGNNRYRILSVIDSGGFSFTYKAIDMIDGGNKEIAIKEFFIRGMHNRNQNLEVVPILNSRIEELQKAREKFWLESDKIKEFSHCPNIVNVHDLFDENGTCYYTMEYINGCDLGYYVKSKRQNALPENDALNIIRSVCNAVKTMHNEKMNHLDIKPENIMIEYITNRIILIDFGTATQFDDKKSSLLNCYSNGYTPIEYMSIHEFCPQKDIYAIGATLYFLLSGENPPSAFDLVNGKNSLIRPENISDRTWDIITRAMQHNYHNRPTSIDELNL